MRTPHHVLVQRSRTMRAAPTLTEEILWQVLRGSRLGVGFRRQTILGTYVVDFVAPSIKLVIEVDGGYHGRPAVQRKDARRDRALGRMGYRVVHVSADAVQHRLGEAVEAILVAMAAGG